MKKRDLRSMAQKQAAHTSGNPTNFSDDQVKNLENMASQFQGKSQSELISELMKRSKEKKADGSLTAESLESFYNNAAPMLTADQRKNMRKLIDQIK